MKRSDQAWFIVGNGMLYTFTAALQRKWAWEILERLYKDARDPAGEVARIRRERKAGKLRAVKATVTWEGR